MTVTCSNALLGERLSAYVLCDPDGRFCTSYLDTSASRVRAKAVRCHFIYGGEILSREWHKNHPYYMKRVPDECWATLRKRGYRVVKLRCVPCK